MTESEALFLQVDSDMKAAAAVYDQDDEATYCQSVAKYQQAVEKTVKAVCAAVEENSTTIFRNRYTHILSSLISILVVSNLQPLDTVFNTGRQTKINNMMQVAPTRDLNLRNTEYPFKVSPGEWQAPAGNGVFTRLEVTECKSLAEQLLADTKSALAQLFP